MVAGSPRSPARRADGTVPALDLRFAQNKSLDSRIVFTRASPAWYYNSDGVLTQAAANEARFDHDPVTLACRGLLIEEARTNLFSRSTELDHATWVKARVTVTPNVIMAPDGTLTADKVVEDSTASSTHIARLDVAVTAGTTYTWSIFAKAGERNQIALAFDTTTFTAADAIIYTLSGAGSMTTLAGTPIGTITHVGSGWYRCTITAVCNTSGTGLFRHHLASGGTITYTGDGSSGAYKWGAQLEAGVFTTSLIMTTTGPATRAVDYCYIPVSTFRYNPLEGAIFADAVPVGVGATGVLQTLIYLDDGTNNERFGLRASGNTLAGLSVDNGATQVNTGTGTITAGIRVRAAIAYRLNDYAAASNGPPLVTDTSATVPTPTRLLIGSRLSGSEVLNAWYARASYSSARTSDPELLNRTFL